MTPSTAQSSAPGRALDLLAQRAGPWSSTAQGRLTSREYRRAYLSTMYRVDGGEEPYLVIVKHHDPGGQRAAREFEVLSTLAGDSAPRALLLDRTGEFFADPVLVTTYVEPATIHDWNDANLDRLARLMAAIHTNVRLMRLDADRGRPDGYSIEHELAEETRDLPSFQQSPVKEELCRALGKIESHLAEWEQVFDDGTLVYVHGDLPHHHVFGHHPHWQVIHWEWSRQSHPTRELARAFWDLEMPAARETFLLERYSARVPYPIDLRALEIQRLLQYFSNAIHVGFWLDRTVDPSHPDWAKAARMCRVVRLWVELGAATRHDRH
jgi:hypothetical protein